MASDGLSEIAFDELRADRDKWWRETMRLDETIERLEAARHTYEQAILELNRKAHQLVPYTVHQIGCWGGGIDGPCSCGLGDLVNSL